MASSIFARLATRRLAAVGGGTGLAALAANLRADSSDDAAIEQFKTSFMDKYKPDPMVFSGTTWKIRNDYPKVDSPGTSSQGLPPRAGLELPDPAARLDLDAPWLKIDYKTHPEQYCAAIKEYCWEGNVNHGFVVQENKVYVAFLTRKSTLVNIIPTRSEIGIMPRGCIMARWGESPSMV
jgi:hypothetical protein